MFRIDRYLIIIIIVLLAIAITTGSLYARQVVNVPHNVVRIDES